MRPDLRIARIRANATLPSYATEGSAGLDVSAAIDSPITIASRARIAVPTGLVLGIPSGHEVQVRPRSGLAIRHGVTVINAPGTIDEDYRGELIVLLINHGDDAVTIAPGDRIAQIVVAEVARVSISEVGVVEDLGTTTRGAAGFGSTGR